MPTDPDPDRLGGDDREQTASTAGAKIALVGWAMVSALAYFVLTWQSRLFALEVEPARRPLLLVFVLWGITFVCYLGAQRSAIRCAPSRGVGLAVVAAALVFRAILLPSTPIQELDYYRYLWDGAVTAQGISPFRYSPADVLEFPASGEVGELRRLRQLADSSPALRTILKRVHYAELTTVYPPVSQVVFASAHYLTPASADVRQRVGVLKIVLASFDVATIALVLGLLRAAARHPGWLVAYAWCPLVLKEFTNTAHLDAIAVCLTTAAIYLFVRASATAGVARPRLTQSMLWASGLVIGLAVGAKLYPIVLVPVLAAACLRRRRIGTTVLWTAIALVSSAISLAPMFWSSPADTAELSAADTSQDAALAHAASEHSQSASNAQGGLRAFLSRWEMNDFLFLLIVENVRPNAPSGSAQAAWFTIVPDHARTAIAGTAGEFLQTDPYRAGFLLTRAITLLVFAAILIVMAHRVYVRPGADALLEALFLSVAWFWLLAPTQNPWYWTWALPLLPFARGRAWWAVSGLVLLYYVRFWLLHHYADTLVLGTRYQGAAFFDFVVTWIEFGPWFAWLFVDWLSARWHRAPSTAADSVA